MKLGLGNDAGLTLVEVVVALGVITVGSWPSSRRCR